MTMKRKPQKRLLLAVDGSDRALGAVKYVSRIPSFRQMHVSLLTVRNPMPEYYWDLETDPKVGRRVRGVRSWDLQQEESLRQFLDKARRVLLHEGFQEKDVAVMFRKRRSGIARDIIKEARRGYNAVVVGRKGMGAVKNLVLGSVATKLLEKVTFTPLFLIGKGATPQKFLIGLDGSENSLKTVDYVGSMLDGSDMEALLVHVIRGDATAKIRARQDTFVSVFEKAKAKLIDYGFRPDKVRSKIITGARSRAGALVDEAKAGGYESIVVGRRGMSRVREFFMGRVSNKVIQLSKGLAVWVVG
jgi:nucleotide-binding universal stress UspA family protein